MKKFYATLSDGSYINVFADELKLQNDAIQAYSGGHLVAFVDIGCLLYCRLDDSHD